MPNFNKVILMGNLIRDPETRVMPSGNAITKIGVAVNRRWKDRESDEVKEETTYVSVDCFGNQASLVSKMAKGDPIMLEGRLRLEQWEDKPTGEKRSKLSVIMENFQYIPKGQKQEQSPQSPAPQQTAKDDGFVEEDIPF